MKLTYVCSEMAETVERFATTWAVRGLNPSVSESFRRLSDRLWGPPILLYIRYGVFFPEVKWPGHGVNH